MNHRHISMNANKCEEDHTAIKVDAEHGDLQLAGKIPKIQLLSLAKYAAISGVSGVMMASDRARLNCRTAPEFHL